MKLRWVLSAVLVVIGLASVFVCYPNLYVLKQEIVDAPHCLQIAPRDNNVAGIYMGMRDAVKVQVIVGNGASGTPSMWGDCSLITSPFQVSIVDGSEELISTIFTPHSPSVRCVFEDISPHVDTFGGVQVSNPEDYPVAVTVAVSFFRKTLDSNFLTLMCIGITSVTAGVVTALFELVSSERDRENSKGEGV